MYNYGLKTIKTIKQMEKITEEQFKKYLKIQHSGKYNMITEARMVMLETGLSKEQYMYILAHYGELKDKYCNDDKK